MKEEALVVVDMLYDFIDGSLACAGAHEAIKNTLKFISKNIGKDGDVEVEILDTFPVLFVRDHHPADHCSFTANGGTWPEHCVAGTRGAEVHDDLSQLVREELTFDKGCDKKVEQYSGADGMNSAGQSLSEVLELLDVKDVFVCGIATEFCVRATCEDLLKQGFKVNLLKDCLAYVDKEGHEKALKEMQEEGIRLV